MPQFKEVTQEDVEYFVRRSRAKTDTIHISKNFSFPSTDGKRRYVYKQIEASENLEVVKLKGELVLTSSPAGRKQVKVLVFEDDGGRISFTLQQFNGKDKPFSGQSVSFYSGEWQKLMTFLGDLNFIDFSDHRNHWYSSSAIREQVLVTKEDKKLVDSFRSLEGDDRISVLQQISEQNLSKDDLDILSGRRNGLAEFTHQLYTAKEWDEPKWQGFFKENHWIFGYGLDYRFMSILRKEAAVSDVDVDGKSTVNADFLMGSTDFTVLVEMKLPSTDLFRGTAAKRSRTWGLSTDLLDAVSQILTQKAEWQVKSSSKNYDENEHIIEQGAADPKAILIVGMRSSLEGSNRVQQTKLNTFELFRRDSRNIEILTYDELYDRAFYIVNQRLPEDGDRSPPNPNSTVETSATESVKECSDLDVEIPF